MGTGGSQDQDRAAALARRAAEAEGRHQDLFTAIPHGLIHYAGDGSIIDPTRRPARSWAWAGPP